MFSEAIYTLVAALNLTLMLIFLTNLQYCWYSQVLFVNLHQNLWVRVRVAARAYIDSMSIPVSIIGVHVIWWVMVVAKSCKKNIVFIYLIFPMWDTSKPIRSWVRFPVARREFRLQIEKGNEIEYMISSE